jgi:hypothetical protein
MTLGKDLEKYLLVKSILVNDYGKWANNFRRFVLMCREFGVI